MKKILTLTLSLILALTASAQSTFVSTLKAKASKGATLYGTVECNGTPLEGVVVSDGVEVVKTDKKGVYNIPSQKKTGYVFISIPSGYEAMTEGSDVVPQLWAVLAAESQTVERHDFNLKKVDNDKHVIVAVADIHLANKLNDVATFTNSFIPSLKAEIEQYKSAGIPVYTLCMGDSSFDTYWYDYLYDITDFRKTLQDVAYPTQFFNTMGNHDNDGATPCDENTDWNASAKYRKAFGPTYYSFNIGRIHYIMLDDQIYHNEPRPDAKMGKGIVGSRNHTTALTRAQLDWLAKDLATVTDKNTP
ncbi:MAG: metallophosphoesterase, partial [Alistipes sp.]|nr:metallophosphoesterase [Alistipes sp.]